MKSNQTRSSSKRTRDRRIIADLYLQGWLQVNIAEKVGISQSTVSNDLKALQKEWLKSSLIDYDEAKSKELARIDRLEREYWDAWQRSLDEFRSTTLKGKRPGDGEKPKPDEQTVRTEDRNGDPRFLAGVQWCIDRRCKVIGIDAPQRNLDINVSNLTIEQLQRIANGEDPIRVLATTGASRT